MEIQDLYKKSIEKRKESLKFEANISDKKENEILLVSKYENAELKCLVDMESEIVTAASHYAFDSELKPFLDCMCEIMINRSIQDLYDHGVIRLEYRLRDHDAPLRVKGLFTPDNSDPVFIKIKNIVRPLYKEFIASTNKEVKRNFWDDTASVEWKKLDIATKKEKLQSSLNTAFQSLGFTFTSSPEVVDIKDDIRIVLHIDDADKKLNVGSKLIYLERILKSDLDDRLELQLESLSDKNKRIQRTKRGDLFVH